jgi:NIPSNAP protein
MLRSKILMTALLPAVFAAGYFAGRVPDADFLSSARAQAPGRVFELRTYTTNEGKLPDLHARFRDHTTRFFEKHGMVNVGYWIPQDQPLGSNTLIYVLSYPNREAAKKSWAAFRADPEWHKARDASEANGKIVAKVDSVYMEATGFSAIK